MARNIEKILDAHQTFKKQKLIIGIVMELFTKEFPNRKERSVEDAEKLVDECFIYAIALADKMQEIGEELGSEMIKELQK